MKRTIIILSVLTLITSLISCDGLTCIKGNGAIVTEDRSIEEFERVIIEGAFDVNIEYSETTSLSIETDENLLDYIETYNSGNRLILDVRDDECLRTNKLLVTITTPYIEEVKLVGSGNVQCGIFDVDEFTADISGSGNMDLDLYTKYLDIIITGSGDFKLDGSADYALIDISGSGDINGRSMPMDTCYATIIGSGDMELVVKDLLDVNISGSGNVYYKGDPKVHSSIDGSGDIKKRN